MQPRYGHLVIQYEANNPGAWSYHCHVAWHASMGLNIALLEGGDELQESFRSVDAIVPKVMQQTCKDWELWTRNNTVDQIDAGI